MAQGRLDRRPLVSLVTDRGRLVGGPTDDVVATLFEQVAAAVDAGVDLIQVREPDLPDRVLVEVVTRCVELARGSRTVILVNDRLDIALAAGAGGMHLRSRSVPARLARRHAPAGFLLGRSVHGVDEAVRVADGGGLDYLVLGTVFRSQSKPGVSPASTSVSTVRPRCSPTLSCASLAGRPMKGLALLLGTIIRIKDRINPPLEISGILFTMINPRTLHSQEVMEVTKRAFGDKIRVFDTIIPSSVRFKEAPAARESILTYDAKSKGADAYRWLTKEVME